LSRGNREVEERQNRKKQKQKHIYQYKSFFLINFLHGKEITLFLSCKLPPILNKQFQCSKKYKSLLNCIDHLIIKDLAEQ